MEPGKLHWLFRAIRWAVRLVYPKFTTVGEENLPSEPTIIIGNHAQMHGPIVGELFLPKNSYIWCAGQMMHLKDVPPYAFQSFWSIKPKRTHWFYKAAARVIAPLSVLLFNNARTIAVYRDTRILRTFRDTIAKLQQGNHVVIFPESPQPYNNILYDFEEHFVDVAKHYYKRTGKEVLFVPLYIVPSLKAMYFGKPIRFSATAPIEEERRRIRTYLMEEITDMARKLPRHTVTPYANISKKEYPVNTEYGD